MSWFERAWNTVRPGRVHRDLDRELAFHVSERADEREAAGMSRDEARRQAHLSFGNYTSQVERTRDMNVSGWLEAIFRDVRLATRTLRKTPAFTATVVLTLALGIGANTAVFSAIYAVLLKPLPFPNGDQLVKIEQTTPKSQDTAVAPPRVEDWNRLNEAFQAVMGYYTQDDSELSGELPEKMKRALITPRFLQVLGIQPMLGRGFTAQEEKFGGPDALIISERLWRRRFGADPNVIGRTLRFGRVSTPIVGVMPSSFLFPDRDVNLWAPSPMDAPYAQNRETGWFTVIGRMKPSVTLTQARANMATVQESLKKQFPKSDGELSVKVEPLKEVTVGGVRRSLWILFGSVSLLLVIACTNIAALLLSRAAGRQHEIAVRFSLGASRAAVIRQLLMEVLLLALAGAAFGLLIAAGASRVFSSLSRDLPRIEEIGIDVRILLYTLASALGATLLCGILPAIQATRRELAGSLASGSRSQVAGGNPVQFVLVGVQVALAVMLLAGAGLLLRSFQELGRVSPGFEPQRVLTFHVSTSWGETSDPKASKQRVNRILDSVRGIPGVVSAATSNFALPGTPVEYQTDLELIEGRGESEPKLRAESRSVTPSYFATMQIPLLSGEVCGDEANPPTMMVNRSFADRYFGGTAVIGHHLLRKQSFIPSTEVRGIVGDARETGLEREPVPTIYWCYGAHQPGTFFLVRTSGDAAAMAETVRKKVREIEPLRSVYELTPLTEHISEAYAENRLRTILLTFFAATAVLLVSLGLYGTMSYLVSVRQREVGLRLALGAMRGQILRQYLAQGLRISLLGCVVGIGLAMASGRLLAEMLFGVTPSDFVTLASVVGVIVAVSVIASLLPAVRASRLEPMQVLREG